MFWNQSNSLRSLFGANTSTVGASSNVTFTFSRCFVIIAAAAQPTVASSPPHLGGCDLYYDFIMNFIITLNLFPGPFQEFFWLSCHTFMHSPHAFKSFSMLVPCILYTYPDCFRVYSHSPTQDWLKRCPVHDDEMISYMFRNHGML